MGKNLTPKIILIIVLAAVSILTLYPPNKTLKPGIDLAGGTSLIYEIDAQGIEPAKRKTLAADMITVLRRRIDPANIQNLIWRPQGGTRFEIQMPLASAEARAKRQNFEKAKSDLLAENISPAEIMRSLEKPAEERAADFNDFTQEDPNRLAILETLAGADDERKELQNKRDELNTELETAENTMASAGIDPNEVKLNVGTWSKLDEKELIESLKEFADPNEHVELLSNYVKKYSEWAEVVNQLTDAEFVDKYENAKQDLDKLNLTEDQIKRVLDMEAKSAERGREIERLKTEFADREKKIEAVVAAYDEYRPFRGRLDDPRDLQRMLKGAGILEFRILPTADQAELDADEINRQVELLKTKGPKFASAASKGKYVWCEIESFNEWKIPNSIVGQFGEKYFVLASNQKDETMLHSTEGKKAWKLESAKPSTDDMGARAIGFTLNDKGGLLFGNLTGNNVNRPLCILLDGIAISAPSINERIGASGIIKGSFTQTDVYDMVDKLNAGSLPARLIEQPVSVKTIGPSIGADNRDRSMRAGARGLFVVIVFMFVYYIIVAGGVAGFALLLNILFILAIMAAIKATFTLPGIAGIILTMGMSVDANVLIFERIREEQQGGEGKDMSVAIKNGYDKTISIILDANITTFIPALVLSYLASEEIKGFAIVLMIGIGSSLFTSLFVTRVWLTCIAPYGKGKIKDLITKLRLVKYSEESNKYSLRMMPAGKWNIRWLRLAPLFMTISTLLIAGCLWIFVTRDDAKNNKYDIEFTGGTSAVLNLKDSVYLSRQQVEDRIRKIGNDPNNPIPALAAARVYSIGKPIKQRPDGEKIYKQYEINTTETNKTIVTITFPESAQRTVESVTSAIRKSEREFGGRLSNLLVTEHSSVAAFVVTTSQMNTSLVKNILTTAFADANVFGNTSVGEPQVDEVVNNAILKAFGEELEIQRNLGLKIIAEEKITQELVDSHPELAEFMGGIKISCETERAATVEEINTRLADLQYKPDMQNLIRYRYTILNADVEPMEPNKPVNSFSYVSVEPEAGFRELSENEWTQFVENERTKVLAATRLETSLPRVTQINPSVGSRQMKQSVKAIAYSLLAILIYIWFRFGSIKYGVAAIITLVHDVCIVLGAVTACTYIAGTAIGEKLLIGDFKINMAMIAAFLTVIGYSLNDTIVVFTRIRENHLRTRARGKIITGAFDLVPERINVSINQVVWRSILTSLTTFLVVVIMYIFGGPGLRGFTLAIGLGVFVGTYSSIAIAAPILLFFPTKSQENKKKAMEGRTKTKKKKGK